MSLRENLEFEWIPGDTGSADRPEPLRKDREALAGETSDYFSDYSNGTNNGALKIYSANVGPANNNGSITNMPATGKSEHCMARNCSKKRPMKICYELAPFKYPYPRYKEFVLSVQNAKFDQSLFFANPETVR